MAKFCIIGLGKFGYQVADQLARNGSEVLAVDRDEVKVNAIKNNVTQALCTEITSEASLRAIGIEEMDTVIIALGRNLAHTVVITQLLKQIVPTDMIIVRASSTVEQDILEQLGADQVILPEYEAATKLADNLSSPFPYISRLSPAFSLVQTGAPQKFIGKTIEELALFESYGIECIGIKRNDEIELARPDIRIASGDILLFVGTNDDLESIARL